MDVFISWSGGLSHAVALAVKGWLKCVLQASRPWLSSQDIDKGSLWQNTLNSQLEKTSIGIVCLTNENANNRWILFESGALAKGITANRVCTLLIDMEPGQVQPPLSQFNATKLDHDGLKSLCSMINDVLNAGDVPRGVDPATFDKVFETNWPELDAQFAKAKKGNPAGRVDKRAVADVQDEMLQLMRGMTRRLSNLEFASANSALQRLRGAALDGDAIRERVKRRNAAIAAPMSQFSPASEELPEGFAPDDP